MKQMAAPLPLILRNPPHRLCTHHLLPPLSTTTVKPFSLVSFSSSNTRSFPILKSTQMEGGEITETSSTETNVIGKKKIFVAGATGNTGKRVVEQLLAKGFSVKAGVRNLEKAIASLPSDNPALQIVKADVTDGTDGSAELAEVISDNSEAVICATGFSYGWDVFAPWKVINHTIIRPGGLRNDPPTENLVMEPEDTLSEGSISRDLVAEGAVEALLNPEASYKVVEIVSRPDAPKRSYEDLFGSIKQR